MNAGGYVLRSFNDVSYITGFAALGRNKNQLDVSNGTLQVDSVFDSTTLRLGASAMGVLRMVGIEIWPELSFSYARSRVGTQAVAAQAYGLTSNNLSLAGGNVEMGHLMHMPQVKWSLADGAYKLPSWAGRVWPWASLGSFLRRIPTPIRLCAMGRALCLWI